MPSSSEDQYQEKYVVYDAVVYMHLYYSIY